MIVTVIGFPRLHVGLIDLGLATMRRYGGAGFTLSGPEVVVTAEQYRSTQLTGLHRIDHTALADLAEALRRLQSQYPAGTAKVHIKSISSQHIGLGTTTALLLAALKAVQIAAGLRIPTKIIQNMSGRGGTSGIGIHSFFRGGFIVDGGHERTHEPHAPSRSSRPAEPPPVIGRIPIPSQWRFHLLLPTGVRRFGREEQQFFRDHTPVPKTEVLASMAAVYHGVSVAVASRNLELLRVSLQQLHSVGFKRRELENQLPSVRELFHELTLRPDCASGLSSMGPLVYVVSANNDKLTKALEALALRFDAKWLGSYLGRNGGFEVALSARV